MASPFNLFRKNQKVMMAVLIGLSMIAFILLDTITPENFPIFLGALLGALALWLLSGKGGTEGWIIAGVGAILGAVVGVYGPGLLGDNTAVYTAEGNLSHREIEEIARSQDAANQFLSLAYRTVVEKLPEDQRRQITPPMPFGIVNVTDAATMRENAVLTFLFEKEADDLGIEVTDEAVSRFIIEFTDGKLTDANLRKIRSQMQIGTGELIDSLREQLRVRGAYQLLSPISGLSLGPATPTPQQLWSDFKKLKTEAEVTAVAIPVEEFVAQVEEPSTEELTRFFEEYKAVPPTADGTPGFLVPRQVQVAYIEMPIDEVKKTVPPPTEEEIREYYEQNKARFEFSKPAESPAGASETPAGEATQEGPVTPATEANGTADPASEATDPGSDATESLSKPEEATPGPEVGAESTSPPAEPEESTTPPETPPGDENSGLDLEAAEFVVFQEEGAQPPAEAGRPSEGRETEPAAETETPSETPAPTAPATPEPAGASEPSKEVLETIREELLDQRARAAADARLEVVRSQVDEIIRRVMDAVPIPEDFRDEEQQAVYERNRKAAIRDVVEQLKEFAEKNKELKFFETPLLSREELLKSGDHPVGSAIRWEKNAPLFNRDQTPVAEMIFGMSPDQPLLPVVAQSTLNESRYVALKVDDKSPHVPNLKDEGVEARVVEAWKRLQARDLAQERAEELAKKASSPEQELASVVEGETITGEDEGQDLTVREVGPFSWLRRTTAPSQDFSPPQIVPTSLPQLPGTGDEFMETVFQDLKAGEAGVAPSVDGSRFFVVELKRKSSAEELASAREEFIQEDFFESPLDAILGQPMNPFRRQTLMKAFELRSKWFDEFRKRHEVIDPEAERVATPAA